MHKRKARTILWTSVALIILILVAFNGYTIYFAATDSKEVKTVRSKLSGRWMPRKKEGFNNNKIDSNESFRFSKYFYTFGNDIIPKNYSIDLVEEYQDKKKNIKYYWRPSKMKGSDFRNRIKYLDDNTLILCIGDNENLKIVYIKDK